MDIGKLISIISLKSEAIAEDEIKKYQHEFPENDITADIKNAVNQRAESQMTMQISKFKFKEDSEIELEDQFNLWFTDSEEADLRSACRHCIADEVKKSKSADQHLSNLDIYLKKHLGSIHEID
ncbi:MAG: hypothetical protein K5773_01750 [Pseudobutyrivibrio sp.]|nr:hypothetical protein [Pseudobutyrivibrio sp.]